MPHGRSADGDDFASTDEVKIYKDEGEDEKRSSENLSEEKIGLVTETEEVPYVQRHCSMSHHLILFFELNAWNTW